MSNVITVCHWCGNRLVQAVQASAMCAVVVACSTCGPYRVPGGISSVGVDIYSVPKNERYLVSAWIRKKLRAGEEPPLINQPTANLIVRNSPRLSPLERMRRLLLVLGDLQKHPGVTTPANDLTYPDAEAETIGELNEYKGWLVHSNLAFSTVEGLKVQLLGWEEIQRLREQRTSTIKRAFVAMWFDDSMDDVFLHGIKPAAADAGYEAYRVKDDKHGERIDAKIIAEIRACRFVIADVTGTRSAVYYEAGFADGLGKPVIWMCRKDNEKDMSANFDTRQLRHIVWTDADDLGKQLMDTIRARIV
jgi:nucleoside 2-deoxyribosyltransferase